MLSCQIEYFCYLVEERKGFDYWNKEAIALGELLTKTRKDLTENFELKVKRVKIVE